MLFYDSNHQENKFRGLEILHRRITRSDLLKVDLPDNLLCGFAVECEIFLDHVSAAKVTHSTLLLPAATACIDQTRPLACRSLGHGKGPGRATLRQHPLHLSSNL